MANHLIIDGYNLLGVSGVMGQPISQEGQTIRESLLRDLERYHHRMGHPITIVFDAWRQLGGGPRREHRAGVTVIYSREGEQADQVIQRMIRELNGDCVVVSSDHEVINTARSHGAMVLKSQEFLPRLTHQVSRRGSGAPRKTEDHDMDLPKIPSKKKGNPRKLPKAVRNRLRNLRKF